MVRIEESTGERGRTGRLFSHDPAIFSLIPEQVKRALTTEQQPLLFDKIVSLYFSIGRNTAMMFGSAHNQETTTPNLGGTAFSQIKLISDVFFS